MTTELVDVLYVIGNSNMVFSDGHVIPSTMYCSMVSMQLILQ